MGKASVYGMVTIRNRLAQAKERQSKVTYYSIKGLDGKYMIATTPNLMDIIKSDLTEEECSAWLRLLKEGE
jgi:hypothetical protein